MSDKATTEVDLVIAGGSLTEEDRKLIRALIQRQKAANKARTARPRPSSADRTKRTTKRLSSKVKD